MLNDSKMLRKCIPPSVGNATSGNGKLSGLYCLHNEINNSEISSRFLVTTIASNHSGNLIGNR